jgi:hypothetical protein
MKKYIILTVLTVMILFLVSCNDVSRINSNVSSMQSSTSKAEVLEIKESSVVSTESDVTSSSSLVLTQAEVKDMLEKNATFDELKDKYNLQIESERDSENFEQISVICDNPEIRFYFAKPKQGSAPYTISYLSAPVSMILSEYLNMPVEEIPILLKQESREIFMYDGYFGYSMFQSKRVKKLDPEAHVVIEVADEFYTNYIADEERITSGEISLSDMDIGEFFAGSVNDLGPPLSIGEDNLELFYKDFSIVGDSYADDPENVVYMIKITDPNEVEINGISMNKQRDELVSVLGEPFRVGETVDGSGEILTYCVKTSEMEVYDVAFIFDKSDDEALPRIAITESLEFSED